MELEIIQPKDVFFEEVQMYKSFLWLGTLYIKIGETNALDISSMTCHEFLAKDEVSLCKIEKISVEMY